MWNNSRSAIVLPLILAATLAGGMIIGNLLTPSKLDGYGTGKGKDKYQKIQDIIEVLDRKYVDSLDGEDLFEKTISDMLHKLDPHSNYIPAKELKAINESIEGKFGGVGIRFFIIRDTICITNIISGSPSQSAGFKAGDKIVSIDGKSAVGKKITNEKVMKMLKGAEGTTVKVKVKRGKKYIEKNIVRGTIPIESVVAAYMINSTTGFIKIDQFSVTTAIEFHESALYLKEKGMKHLILDLRNNGGGVLTAATDIADEFLKKNVPMLITKGKELGKKTYRATSGGILESTGVTILINANSASASEILAGAIQDNDRGTIVGRRSFGKGLVQEDIKLRDGSDLRLTIARYYTPTGRCIQRPYDEGYDKYIEAQVDRYDNGELYAPDSSLFVDSLKFRTPKGKIVYGGGGIMPDVFVPFDSTGFNWYFTELRFSQAFTAFTFEYVQDKRNKWSSVEDYARSFKVSDELISSFVRYAEKEMKIKQNTQGLLGCKTLIAETLKAEIARQLWTEHGYFQIVNAYDNEVQKALKVSK